MPVKKIKQSSAPHVAGASTVEAELLAIDETHRVLPFPMPRPNGFKAGILTSRPCRMPIIFERDQLSHFTAGKATYTGIGGETINVEPGTLVHFRRDWTGELVVHQPLRQVYGACSGGSGVGATPVLADVARVPAEEDWGPIPNPLEGEPRTSGIVLAKDGLVESGVWVCTPGKWALEVGRDEYCHFLTGRCTYTHESGEVIEVGPDTAVFFPKGWKGTCQVHETVRKVYLLR